MADKEEIFDIERLIDTDDPRHAMIIYLIMIVVSLLQGASIAGIIVAMVAAKAISTIIGLLIFNMIALACHYIAINILKHMLDGAVKTSEDNVAVSATKG